MTLVFVFHGSTSRFANAVFSTHDRAAAWIREHKLSGMLTRYDLDDPAFDRRLASGQLPRLSKTTTPDEAREWYVDPEWHRHYFFGIGEDEPGFLEASDRWDEQNDALE